MLLCLTTAVVFADLKLENPECRTVILSDDGTWHYASSGVEQKNYKEVTLNELRSKFPKLKGKPLKVSGVGVVIIDTYFIKDDINDDSPIEINVSAIPKGITDKLETECEKGCEIKAYGQVAIAEDGYKTLVLERLEIEE